MAPGSALLDAAPRSAVPSSSALLAGCYGRPSTISDSKALSTQQQQQQQPLPPQGSSNHALPLTTNNSSYSFSFCGSDAFGVNDVADGESAGPQSQQPSALPRNNNTNSNNNAGGGTTNGLNAGAIPGAALNSVVLSAATLEYFYGIPTPSAPPRTPYAASSASNGSSSHHQHQQNQRHASASRDSIHTASSADVPTVPPRTSSLSTSAAAAAATTTTTAPSGGAIQKDVLAFMAAEQQQQKFVLQQRNVYMSGLPVDFRPSAFRAMCEVFGRIESSKLCMEADDASRCRGFGFVLFYDVDSANSCISSLNGKVMQGKTLQVRRADLSAAPQPLNPVTQRNRTGSGLVTPPSLPPIQANTSTAGMATAFPVFSPHPPTQRPGSNSNSSNMANNAGHNTISPSIVMSTLPFTFATPTIMGPGPVHSGSSNSNINNTALIPQKGSATGSSFLYGGPSASSSLGTSSTPTMVYPANATMVPAIHNGVPVVQLFASVPAPPAPNTGIINPPQQQQTQLVSHPSMSRSEPATSHTATPSSAGSSNMNVVFSTAPQFVSQPQQQSQQLAFQPQPPMHPPMQPQRPLTSGSNVAFYGTMDGQGPAIAPAVMAAAGMPNNTSNGGMYSMNNQNNSMYASSLLMQEYLAAAGLEPTASNSNIYYLFPQ
jgi:RNA recognition motif-containing protein